MKQMDAKNGAGAVEVGTFSLFESISETTALWTTEYRLEASAVDRRLDSGSAELSGRYVLERTDERADRRADRTRVNNSVG
jgi:hypothetical protein